MLLNGERRCRSLCLHQHATEIDPTSPVTVVRADRYAV